MVIKFVYTYFNIIHDILKAYCSYHRYHITRVLKLLLKVPKSMQLTPENIENHSYTYSAAYF